MTCAEVREYLFAFLDSELDAPLSIEFQRHLDHCPECARETEVERTIHKKLELSMTGATCGDITFDPSGKTVIQPRGKIRSASHGISRGWRGLHRGQILGLAAVIVAAVGVILFNFPRNHRSSEAVPFVDSLVIDFAHFIEEGAKIQVVSADREVVEDWLAERTELDVTLPALSPQSGRLLGGRKCTIGNELAAFAVYEIEGSLVSLVVVDGKSDDLSGMVEVRHDQGHHWIDKCRGHTVIACRRNGLLYAAVSRLPEEKLLLLMTESANESN